MTDLRCKLKSHWHLRGLSFKLLGFIGATASSVVYEVTQPAVADPEFYNGGGRSTGGAWGGAMPPPQKKNEFLPETGGFWCILGLLFTFKKA